MKRFLTTSIIAKTCMVLALTVFVPSTVTAQDYESTPVTISREKVRIGGQVCYSHVVLEKQTLFSIAKAYNVNVEDIYKYNPGVKENGLKKNSILIIPVVESPKEETRPKAEEPKPEETRPEAVQTKPAEEPVQAEPADRQEQITTMQERQAKSIKARRRTHTVKWYEDLDSIAEKYGVTPYAIMKANNLTGRKLTKRQKLIIPNPGEYPEDDTAMPVMEEQAASADSTETADTLLQEEERQHFFPVYFPKKEIELSLLLPLKATGTGGSRQNLDFYSGVLLAVYEMAEEGISTYLNVFDVAGGSIPEAELIKGSDVVIGPVSSGDISRTFIAAPGLNSLVSPLDPRAEELTYSNESMIHAPVPHYIQHNDLVKWLKEDMNEGDKVIVITEKGSKPTDGVTSMITAIDTAGVAYTPLSYSILEGRDVPETLKGMMTETNANRIYIASESEAFVNDVVRNLNVMIHQKYNVVLYAPSKIRSFETIEVENFHNTKMRVSTGYYIDYNDPKVRSFLLRYRALFNAEPSQFAYQGYDVAKYFIRLSSRYGNRWMEKIDDDKESMLQSTFDFSKAPNGGYINNGVRRIEYGDNWSVRKIR